MLYFWSMKCWWNPLILRRKNQHIFFDSSVHFLICSKRENKMGRFCLLIRSPPLMVQSHWNKKETQMNQLWTQIEDFDGQIPKEPAGKRWKKCWILQEYTGSHRNMEAAFQPENFRTFSGDLRPVPGGKHRKVIGMHRKKSGNFAVGILLHIPVISGVFLPEPSRTLWPGKKRNLHLRPFVYLASLKTNSFWD